MNVVVIEDERLTAPRCPVRVSASGPGHSSHNAGPETETRLDS
jgi:hypothetical protein